MRMIVAAILVASLPVFGANAEERPAKRTHQYQQQQVMPSGLIEGRQSAISSFPDRGVALTPHSLSPRDLEENWFARAENRGESGGGGGD